MGLGVALFDYDNRLQLDIFMVNGAPPEDPTPKGTFLKRRDRKHWNRLYHEKPDRTFEDVTEKAGLRGAGYWRATAGCAVGDYDNNGYEDLYITAYGLISCTTAMGSTWLGTPGVGWLVYECCLARPRRLSVPSRPQDTRLRLPVRYTRQR